MIELKGSFCFEGTEGTTKTVYSVRFKDADTALNHIMTKFGLEDVVKHFWYGYHINGVNKTAKGKPSDKRTEAEAYDKAEEILDGDFPDMVFERGVDKTITISPETKQLQKLIQGKGLSLAQFTAMLEEAQEQTQED